MTAPRPRHDGGWHFSWLIAVAIGVALLLILAVGFGVGAQWGASQFGPLSEWVAGIATTAAVVVALRQAIIAQRQAGIAQQQAKDSRDETIRLQFERLVDHEISRRRECIDALSDLWGAIVSAGPTYMVFIQEMDNIDGTRDFFQQYTPSGLQDSKTYAEELVERIQDFFAQWLIATQPPLFRARLILRGTPLQSAVKDINTGLKTMSEEGLPSLTRPIAQNRAPDTETIRTLWKDLNLLRDGHMRLAEEHFSLRREDAAEAVRQNELQG
ncbi:MAG TPA: hypothetical protein VFA16_05530 [Mycobacterium sp.]|uniref:hypothetical protein n=1 Tax=Mycobacterium sp. TaxID=1785 RepID=UPI002D377217|nr:hypothetical protein [Mycobacterium sp.]HZU46706.1 hypothetical protein [Mycobacterium sp.]